MQQVHDINQLQDNDQRFLSWLRAWTESLPTVCVDDPANSAVVVVDMVNGFCKTGNLASERINAVTSPLVEALKAANASGVGRYLIAEDTHREHDREFAAFPPHCIRGSGEEKTVEEITSLPFADRFQYFPKPTINISVGTDMDERLQEMLGAGVHTFVVTGDCTDLCVYQAASYLRLAANAQDRDARVIVPRDLVDTYDLSPEVADSAGAMPHPGDLLHQVFLYHLALIGCEVVANVEWGGGGVA